MRKVLAILAAILIAGGAIGAAIDSHLNAQVEIPTVEG